MSSRAKRGDPIAYGIASLHYVSLAMTECKKMSIHKPVLLKEVIESLNLKEGDTVVDATLGGGGHSREILSKIGKKGKLIAIDLDEGAIEKFETSGNVCLVRDNFANLENILADLKIDKVNAILADLGWSSDQLINRGMSFREDEKLDMRLDRNQELDAGKVINEYSQEKLGEIIKDYGEERFYKRIVGAIIKRRKSKKIETTRELADLIRYAVPVNYRYGRINPATRTFQAIRIEVNRELENLKRFIPQAIKALKPKGRLAIISFHSLEDRIVKNSFRENAGGCIFPRVKIITKKPVVATDEEVKGNPRARSTKLRVCELG